MSKEQAFTSLLDEQKDRVYSNAVHVLQHPEDAEDVVQHSFIQLWRQWDRVETEKRGRWLMQVVHNRCMDNLRRRRSTRERFLPPGEGHLETASRCTPSIECADRAAEFADAQRVLRKGMATLPETTRSMLVLHYFHDMPLDRIAEMLRLPVGTVKAALHRGRKKLREFLGETYPELVESR
jgi:RNA polymerase sigma-70 factor (ECF subfamily)